MYPAARSVASKRANSGPTAPALVSFSRNSQIVRAFGNRSDSIFPCFYGHGDYLASLSICSGVL